MKKWLRSLKNQVLVFTAVLVLLGLYQTSRYSDLLFHTIIEFVTIIIGFGIFMMAWHTRRYFENNYLKILGIAYLFICVVDFLHALTYKGMSIIVGYDADLPTQLWIVARYMQSITLLVAPFFLQRKLKPGITFGIYAIATALLVGSVFYGIFPACYIEGTGLTAFYKSSETIISLLFLVSAGLLFYHRKAFDKGILNVLLVSNILTIFAELAFTFYVGVYDLSNLIGHLFKFVAFGLIYSALIRTGLEKLYDQLFWNLKQNEMELQEANDLLEVKVSERTRELDQANVHLRSELVKREQKEIQIQQQLKRITSLHAIDLAITKSFDFPRMAEVVLENVEIGLKIDAAAILLFDKHSQKLEFAATRGFRGALPDRSGLQMEQGPAVRSALAQSIVIIPDLALAGEYLPRQEMFKHEGFTAYHAAPLIVEGHSLGVLEVFHRKTFVPNQEWLDFLATLAGQTAIAIDKITLLNDLRNTNAGLVLAYDATISGWSHALDLRNKETEGHTQRVAGMTAHLARAMGVSEYEIIHMRRGAMLHDIGKMGIPDAILLKPGKLDDDEWKIMRKHPTFAYEILSSIKYLYPALDIPYSHHEKWDGSGYPRGLQAEEIPLAARIFAVVDVWDALRFDRPYRQAWEDGRVYDYIQSQAGTHFDPRVVECFLNLTGKKDNRSFPPFDQL